MSLNTFFSSFWVIQMLFLHLSPCEILMNRQRDRIAELKNILISKLVRYCHISFQCNYASLLTHNQWMSVFGFFFMASDIYSLGCLEYWTFGPIQNDHRNTWSMPKSSLIFGPPAPKHPWRHSVHTKMSLMFGPVSQRP